MDKNHRAASLQQQSYLFNMLFNVFVANKTCYDIVWYGIVETSVRCYLTLPRIACE